ncbi:MAG: putative metal-binding motif-containing protein [Alphaproteobacteria bacterium]|nr:putative metal-binding motif-containing protein [Alphaproteobacteria bacterium]
MNPGATEVCNGIDDDCDGDVDDADPSLDPRSTTVWFPDIDGDGQGDGAGQGFCEQPDDFYVDNDLDCDDADPSVFSGSLHDEDQDGQDDVGCSADGEPGVDCDDDDATVFDGAIEICDGQRNDCGDEGWARDVGVATWLARTTTQGTCESGLTGDGAEEEVCAVVDCATYAHLSSEQELSGECCLCSWTEVFAGGSADSPVALALPPGGGALKLCEGEFFGSLSWDPDANDVVLEVQGAAQQSVSAYKDQCTSDDHSGMTTLWGAPELPVVGVARSSLQGGGERLVLRDLILRSGGEIVADELNEEDYDAISSGAVSLFYVEEFLLEDVCVRENAAYRGGGIWCKGGSEVDGARCGTCVHDLRTSTFYNNKAVSGGSAIHAQVACDMELEDVDFLANSVDEEAHTRSGSVYVYHDARVILRSSLISGTQGGYGLWVRGHQDETEPDPKAGTVCLDNVTVADNEEGGVALLSGWGDDDACSRVGFNNTDFSDQVEPHIIEYNDNDPEPFSDVSSPTENIGARSSSGCTDQDVGYDDLCN